MTYVDTYLKAESEAALIAALESAGVLIETDGVYGVQPGHWLDVIGVICDIDSTDLDNPITIPIDGFHANLRSLEPPGGLEAITIEPPDTPYRVWA